MKLIYNTDATPKQMGYGQTLLFALQQLLAILAATILVPMIVNPAEMTVSAALFGAGVGTLVYQLFTKFRSPVFLGSSFAFLSSMGAAFAGAVTVALWELGMPPFPYMRSSLKLPVAHISIKVFRICATSHPRQALTRTWFDLICSKTLIQSSHSEKILHLISNRSASRTVPDTSARKYSRRNPPPWRGQ